MKNKIVETFNSLLRGERSALETYETVIGKLTEGPPRVHLEKISSGHRRKIAELERHILSLGGTPEIDSGSWGVLVSVVQSVANKLGDKTAVYSLKEGEVHGLRSYKSSLRLVADRPESMQLINAGISAQQENVIQLESMLASVAA